MNSSTRGEILYIATICLVAFSVVFGAMSLATHSAESRHTLQLEKCSKIVSIEKRDDCLFADE